MLQRRCIARMALESLQACMAALREGGLGADFRLVLGEEVILAHRALLVAR